MPNRAALTLLVATAAVYAQTLWSSFHFDDYAIFADPAITASDGWWRVFRLGQTRPLTYLTFWLNYRLGGGQAWGYHAVNVAAHLSVTAAAWGVFRRLVPQPEAWAAAALFALHPIQTEAVAYVFARATMLATLFCLLAWRDWLDGRLWRAALWFIPALLAKEECVAFPIFLGLVSTRRQWRPIAAMVAASVAAGVRLLWVAAHTPGAGLGSGDPWAYLRMEPQVVVKYFGLFVWPAGQNFDHEAGAFSAAGVAALAVLIGVAVWKRHENGVWLLGALVLLAPSSSIVPVADLMFEHRMYLPMISLAVAAGIVLARLPRPAGAAAVLALAVLAANRTRVWKTEETLWSDAAAKSPNKLRPKLQLARAIAAVQPDRARALLLEARRLDPSHPETYNQMGALLLDQRNPQGALEEFDAVLRLAPLLADAHSNRGTALFLLGRRGEAEAAVRRALAIDPGHANARHNLSVVTEKPAAGVGRREDR